MSASAHPGFQQCVHMHVVLGVWVGGGCMWTSVKGFTHYVSIFLISMDVNLHKRMVDRIH